MTTTLGATNKPATIPLPPALEVVWPQPAVLEALREVNLLAAWLERRLEQQLEALLQPLAGPPLSLEELRHHWFGEQAASLFLSRRGQLEQVLLSVLQLGDGHLAQELWFRLQAGEADFAALSHLSSGPEREQGCRIGPVPMAQLDAELVHLLERCQPGELAPPVEQADGSVLLLRLEQRWQARHDQPSQQALERELYDTWLQQQLALALASEPAPGQLLSIELPAP
jgi:hypothetical protein